MLLFVVCFGLVILFVLLTLLLQVHAKYRYIIVPGICYTYFHKQVLLPAFQKHVHI